MAVFFYDLLRTTRRGHAVVLRTAYALVLLAALGWSYVQWLPPDPSRPVPPARMDRFAERFSQTFLVIQFAAVVILTPAYTAGAIAEERQRRTLDGLLAAPLTGGQIVLGKLTARLLQLGGVLLTGLPVLALTPLWGGVDPGRVLAAFALTGLTMMSIGAIGLFWSVRAQTVRGAVATTYATVAVLGSCMVCLSPLNPAVQFAELFGPGDPWLGAVVPCAALHASVVVGVLRVTGVVLRRDAPPAAPAAPAQTDRPAAAEESGSYSPRSADDVRLPVGEWPLLWKELNFGGAPARVLSGGMITLVLLLLFLTVIPSAAIVWVYQEDRKARDDLAAAVAVIAVALLGLTLLGTAGQAAAGVGREREQRTLDGLLTLPDGPDAVLAAKWWGGVLAGRRVLLVLALIVLAGVGAGSLHPLSLPLLAATVAAHLAFVASLGLYQSVATTSTGRAVFGTVLALLATCVVPLAACVPAMSPPVAWLGCVWTWDGQSGRAPAVVDQLACAGLYALGAGLLWALACHRFLRESDRAPARA
jgi:ABC-type transport system involved in multi-copper enzyme maturation permease subunit